MKTLIKTGNAEGFFKRGRDIARHLTAETEKVMAQSDVRDKLREWGMAINLRTGAEFAAFVRADIARWRPVIIASGAQID